MATKKESGSKGAGAGGAGGSAGAQEDLQAKVDALQSELGETKGHLKKAMKELERTRGMQEDKQFMRGVEASGELEEARHEMELLKAEVKRLELDKAAQEVLQKENERLSRIIVDLQDKMSDLVTQHAVETHTIKKETFNARMQLESAFRKTLKELDKMHHDQAYEEMDEESKSALVERARVQDELALQTIGIESLTSKFQEQSRAVKELRTDKEIFLEQQRVQTRKVASLKQQVEKLEASNATLEAQVEELRVKSERVEGLVVENKSLKAEKRSVEKEHERSRQLCESLKEKVLSLSKKLKRQPGGKEEAKKRFNMLSRNDDLLEALTRIGKQQKKQQGSREESANPSDLKRSQHSELVASAPLLPATRKSEYAGILETWNAKFNSEKHFF